MTQKQKYQLVIVGMVIAFLFLASTEVLDRWLRTAEQFVVLREKQQAVLNPDELAEKKLRLMERKEALASAVMQHGDKYEQSQTGEFEFLNACATKSGVRFESLIPIESKSSGEIEELGFRILLKADYHRAGKFVNEIENGSMVVRVTKLELAAAGKSRSQLDVTIEGVGFIYPTKEVL